MTARFAWRKDGGGIGGVDQVQKERIRALGMVKPNGDLRIVQRRIRGHAQ